MTTNQEREMLLGKAEKRRGGGRRLLIGAAVVLLVLVALVAFAVPPIAGAIASGTYPVNIGGGTGSAKIEGVSLSWFGPQKVQRVLVTDASGATVADLNVRATTGALGALRGDLGTITLGGEVNVPEPAPAKPEVNPSPGSGSGAGAKAETTIPQNLRFEAKADNLRLTLPAANGSRVAIEGVNAQVNYADGRSLDATLTATSPVIDARLSASGFSDAQGRLTLDRLVADLVAKAEVPAATVHAVAGTTPRPTEQPTRLSASLVARDGRIRLADPSKPATLSGSIPGAVLEKASGGGVRITESRGANIEIDRLDFPIASGTDWRTVALHATAHLDQISGFASLGGANEPERALVVEPTTIVLATGDEPGVVTAKGGTRLLLDQQPAGTVNIDALVKARLNESGRFEAGLPERLTAEVALIDVPTGLFEGIGDDLGVPLREAVGPTMTAVLRARTLDSSAGAPRQPSEIPTTEITANVKSANLSLDARFEADERSVRGPGVAIKADAKRLAPALRTRLANAGADISGDGPTTLEVRDVVLPLEGGMPALSRLAFAANARTGGLTLRSLENPERPIAVNEASAGLSMSPGAPITSEFASRMTAAGSPVSIDGNAVIEKLISSAPGGGIDLTPEQMIVNGRATLSGVPTDLAGLVPEPWGSAVIEAAGPTIGGLVEAKAEGPQKNTISVNLKGDGVAITGGIERIDRVVTTTGGGLTLELAKPGPLLAAASKGGDGAGVRVDSAGPVRFALTELEAQLPETGDADLGALKRLRAAFEARPARLVATTESGTETIELDASTVGFSLAPDRRMNLSVKSGGSASGHRFTAGGDLALGTLPNDADRIWKSLEPKGTIEAKGVPTALALLVAPEIVDVLREGVGPTVDLAVVAPAPGEPGSTRSAAVSLKSENLTVQGPAALAENELRVGPVEATAKLTPGLLRAGVMLANQDPFDTPTVQGTPIIRATVQQARFRTGPSGAPDWGSVGVIRGMVALEGDAIVGNLPGLTSGTKANLGLRGFEAGLVYDRADGRGSKLSAKGVIFDHMHPHPELAHFSAESALPANGAISRFSANAAVSDVVRLDAMLGAGGLIGEAIGKSLTATASGDFMGGGATQGVTVAVESPRLKLSGRGAVRDGILALVEPASGTWEMPPSLADRYLLGIAPDDQEGNAARVAEPVRLSIAVPTFAMTAPGRPFDRTAFKLDARASAPALTLATAQCGRIVVSNPTLTAATGASPGSVSVTAVINETSAQSRTTQGRSADGFRADGQIQSLIAADGTVPSPDASLTGKADGTLPTALLDVLTDHEGVLVDLLGPQAQLSLSAQSLSKQSGSLDMRATTDRASASVQGVVESETFRATQPLNLSLTKIAPELSNRVFEKVMPLLAEVQKTESDKPAVIKATGFTAPLDGNLSRLNGLFDVDLGTVSFKTSTLFGHLVSFAQGNKEGRAGERFKPFQVKVANGVATYDRVEVPLGQFSVVTSGTVNLVTQEIDLVTSVPASSISKDIASAVSKIPVLSNAAMIPIRTRGTFKNNKSEVDPTLIIQESLPGNIIRGIGDLLNGGKKEEKVDTRTPEQKAADQAEKERQRQEKQQREAEKKQNKQNKRDGKN